MRDRALILGGGAASMIVMTLVGSGWLLVRLVMVARLASVAGRARLLAQLLIRVLPRQLLLLLLLPLQLLVEAQSIALLRPASPHHYRVRCPVILAAVDTSRRLRYRMGLPPFGWRGQGRPLFATNHRRRSEGVSGP